MTKNARFVSNLTLNTIALVLAGGRGSRLNVLTDWRTKPAVPFGGKFRIIDFTLSNCLNSGIRRICVLTQYKSHSLIQHLLQGWNRFNPEQGEVLDLIPAQQWIDEKHWFEGTADAVFQSMDIIESYNPKYVLILAGDHIYQMDYGEMLAKHVASGADFSIACNVVDKSQAHHFGVVQVGEKDRIISFEEKPQSPQTLPDQPDKALVSMGIYVVSIDYLREQLKQDAEDATSDHDFGKDIIPKGLRKGAKIQAYRFRNPVGENPPYWQDVGTIDAFYEANMELLSKEAPLDVYQQEWPIYTYQQQLPPARFTGEVERTMVSGGCVIDQVKLKDSILFSDVKVHEGCELTGVLALPGCEIEPGAKLNRVILDNQCLVPAGTEIGFDAETDHNRFHVTEGGVVVVNRDMLGQAHQYMPGIVTPDVQDT